MTIVGSTEAPSKVFLLFFLLPDWLKLNHLKSRMECGFSGIFSRHFCLTVAETIGVTINPASFGAKNVQKTTFEAAETILGPWNQQLILANLPTYLPGLTYFRQMQYQFKKFSEIELSLYVSLMNILSISFSLKHGFLLQQTPRPQHKKQSDYVLEQSSFPIIALFCLKIGCCRGRNWLYGNQA